MHSTMDVAPHIGMQPRGDAQTGSSLFFVMFISVGTFFVMNLLIAVYIDSFNQSRGTGLLTDKQIGWVELKRTMKSIKPRRVRNIPRSKVRIQLYSLVTATEWKDCTNDKEDDDDDRNKNMVGRELTLKPPIFESVMSIVILLNTAALSMIWLDQSQEWKDRMRWVDFFFVAIYCFETAAKIGGLGHKVYFRGHWNKFDFAIVLFSIMDLIPFIHENMDTSIVQTTRLLRMIKLVRRVQGLRALVRTLFMSLPAIFNLATLLIIVFFVYAVMGVQLFCGAPFQDFLTADANFENFGNAMFLLMRVTTGENWNGIMHDIEQSGPCGDGETAPCPHKWASRLYFVSFYVLAAFVFMKLFIAVILDNFASSFNQEASAVDPAHLAEYRKLWYPHDLKGTGKIPVSTLRRLLLSLPKPLGPKGGLEWTRREYQEVQTEVIERSNDPETPQAEKVVDFQQLLQVLSLRCVGLPALEYRERVHRFHSQHKLQKAVAATLIGSAIRGRIARRRAAKEGGGTRVFAASAGSPMLLRQLSGARLPPKREPEPEPEPMPMPPSATRTPKPVAPPRPPAAGGSHPHEVIENPLAVTPVDANGQRRGAVGINSEDADAMGELAALSIPGQQQQDAPPQSPVATREEVMRWGPPPPPGVQHHPRIPPGVSLFESEPEPSASVRAAPPSAALSLAEAMARFASELGAGIVQQQRNDFDIVGQRPQPPARPP